MTAALAPVRLFVYGSLKRAGLHHEELRGALFLGEAETAPGYALEALGQYWALVTVPEGTGVVRGELFEVNPLLLPSLDDFEGAEYSRGALLVKALTSPHLGMALAYFKQAR
jgi:gamma-glutamylcyclotransferase (GGCT)/AIG2-like uncharacterized protein YtfP